jgi:TPM domain
MTVEEYARDTFRSWKPGQVGRNNGVVLHLFVEDRKIRIQTGLGLEKYIPDKLCKQIIDKDMVPRLRVVDFDGWNSSRTFRNYERQLGMRIGEMAKHVGKPTVNTL